MAKKNLAGKKVIKAMSLGISAVLAVMTPMTEVMTVSALADTDPDPGNGQPGSYLPTDALATGVEKAAETAENEQKEITGENGFEDVAKNAANDAKDKEDAVLEATTAGIAYELMEGTDTENGARDDAEEAVKAAGDAKKSADDAVEAGKAAVNLTTGTAAAGIVEAEDAKDEIEEVKTDLVSEDGKSGLRVDYDAEVDKFDADVRADIDSIVAKNTGLIDTTIGTDSKNNADIKVTITDENGSEDKLGAEFAAEQADAAKQAVVDAQTSLDTALSFTRRDEVRIIDGKEVTIEDVLKDVTEVVGEAQKAYDNTKQVLNLETEQYNKLVNAYNNFIDEYGLGESISKLAYIGDYTETPFAGKTKVVEKAELDTLLNVLKQYGENEIANAQKSIKTTQSAVGRADEAQRKAVAYANEAIDAAKRTVDYADDAIESAQKVVDAYVDKQNAENLAAYKEERDGKLLKDTDDASSAIDKVYKNGDSYYSIGKYTGADGEYALTDPEKTVNGKTTTTVKYTYDSGATKGEFVFDGNQLVYKVTADVKKETTVVTTDILGTSGDGYSDLENSEKLTKENAEKLALAEAEKLKQTNTDTSKSDFANFTVDVQTVNDEYEQTITYLTYDVQDTSDYNAQEAALYNEYLKYINSKGYSNPVPVEGEDNVFEVKDGDKKVVFKFSVEDSHVFPESSNNTKEAKEAAYSDYLSTVGYTFDRMEDGKVIAKDKQGNEIKFEMSFDPGTEAKKINATVTTYKEVKAGDVIYKRNGCPELGKAVNGSERQQADDRKIVPPTYVTPSEYYNIPFAVMTDDGLVKAISWVDEYDGRVDGKWVVYYKLYYPKTEPKDRLEELTDPVKEKVNNNFALVSGNITVKKGASHTLIGTGKTEDEAEIDATNKLNAVSGAKDASRSTVEHTFWDWQFKYSYTYTKTTSSSEDLKDELVASTKFSTTPYKTYDGDIDPKEYAINLENTKYDKDHIEAADISGSVLNINNTEVEANKLVSEIGVIKANAREANLVGAQTSMAATLQELLVGIGTAKAAIDRTNVQIETIEGYVNQTKNIDLWGNFLKNGGKFTYAYVDNGPEKTATVEMPYSIVRAFTEQEAGSINMQSIEEYGPDFYLNDEDPYRMMELAGDTEFYWALNSDGMPTGKAYTKGELPTAPGTYTFVKGTNFVKTIVKPSVDSPSPYRMLMRSAPISKPLYYILGGELYTYKIDPPYNPGPGGDDPDGTLPSGGLPTGGDVPTGDDSVVTLAVMPTVASTIAPVPQEGVLGARRTAEGPAVLGAKRGLDKAVLGKKRAPETGDSMAVFGWLTSLMTSLGGTGIAAGALKKSKKKEDDAE